MQCLPLQLEILHPVIRLNKKVRLHHVCADYGELSGLPYKVRLSIALPWLAARAVAARFCPKLFEPSPDAAADRRQSMLAEGNPFDLPYRMVFAVATVGDCHDL